MEKTIKGLIVMQSGCLYGFVSGISQELYFHNWSKREESDLFSTLLFFSLISSSEVPLLRKIQKEWRLKLQ